MCDISQQKKSMSVSGEHAGTAAAIFCTFRGYIITYLFIWVSTRASVMFVPSSIYLCIHQCICLHTHTHKHTRSTHIHTQTHTCTNNNPQLLEFCFCFCLCQSTMCVRALPQDVLIDIPAGALCIYDPTDGLSIMVLRRQIRQTCTL
jgi:hypothetical protein